MTHRPEISTDENILWYWTFSEDDYIANDAMAKLKLIDHTWHFCEAYDDMAICEKLPEYEHCYCNKF